MDSCSIRTLGPLELAVAGKPVALGGLKQRVVLAMLALRRPGVVSTDELIEAVWADDMPARPSSVLRVYVANLRRLLEPGRPAGVASARLVGDARGYSLRLAAGELDVTDFGALVTEAHAAVANGDLVEGRQQLQHALSLWRGSAFPDLVDVPTARPEISALEERRLITLEESIELGLALGRHSDVVVELERLIGEHPYRERLRTMHAVALYRCQRQTDALAAVREAARVLGDELGLEPGPELKRLEVAVLRHDPSLLGPAPGHTGQRTRRRLDNLPASPTSLIGRQADIDAVRGLILEHNARLVTLCGPGGTGKTRLAVAVAEEVAETMADGACFVDLAPLIDEQQIVSALAGTLGVTARAADELETAVHSFLRPRHLILVLDNYEHLLSAWSVPARLLAAAPKLTMVITSRSALGISGEQRYDVSPLAVPAVSPLPPRDRLARIPAVELFTDRARLVDHRFQLTDHNARSVAELCRRLDGLPLALELVAAHAAAMAPADMLQGLEDHNDLLTGGPRDRPNRQQTMRAAIAWSYDNLSTEDQEVFAQLAVFAGAALVDDVVAVCHPDSRQPAQIIAALERLVAANLIRRQRDPLGNRRVSMLQVIREFAFDQLTALAGSAELQRRHAARYLALAEEVAEQLHGAHQAEAFKRLQAEDTELTGALIWASSDHGDPEVALRLIGTLWHYWEISGDVTVPRKAASRVLSEVTDIPETLRAPALSGLATLCWLQGDVGEATRLHHEALVSYDAIDDRSGVAWSQMCLATQAVVRSDLDEATRLATIARHAAAHLGDYRTAASALVILGVVAWYRGDGARAQALHEEGLTLCRNNGDEWSAAKSMINLADVAEGLGQYEKAASLLADALRTSRKMGDHALAVYCVEAIAELRLHAGLPSHAARLFAACEAFRSDMALPLDDRERELRDALVDKARLAAGSIAFAIAETEGSAMSLDDAAEEALIAIS